MSSLGAIKNRLADEKVRPYRTDSAKKKPQRHLRKISQASAIKNQTKRKTRTYNPHNIKVTMPKAFTQKEKQIIRQQLIDKSLEQFSKIGVRAARIDEICANVGIAKGSFYAFFRSKEELFMVLANERDAMHKRDMLDMVLTHRGTARDLISSFFDFVHKRILDDPILSIVRDTGEINHLIRKAPPELMAENAKRDKEFLVTFTDTLREERNLPNASASVLENLMSILLAVALQQEHLQQAGSYDGIIDIIRELFLTKLLEGHTK